MKKRLIAALLALVLIISCTGGVSAREAFSQTQVESRLRELMAEYCGTYWWSSFHGATQCKGFADLICSELYGDLGPGPYSDSRYYLPRAEDMGYSCLGILSYGYGYAGVRALLNRALPGDYVQCVRYTGTQHSMIVVETNAYGVTFFDCNLKGSCLCASYTYSWAECGEYLTGGISLYRKNGYVRSGAPRLYFDARGGQCSVECRITPTGSPIGSLPRPDRKGFRFDYWYTLEISAYGVPTEVLVSPEALMGANDTVLFASWSEDTGPCGLLGHTWSPVRTVNPTCTADGYVVEHCAVCGETRDTTVLPALGHDYRLISSRPATNVENGEERYQCARCQTVDVRPVICMLNRFTDISRYDWFFPFVRTMVERSLMNGTSASTFGPDSTLTRAMLVTILWRIQGEPQAEASDFADVPGNAWYASAVNWGFETGIIRGVTADRFAPDVPVTREQAAVILHRFSPQLGYDTTQSAELSGFYDAKYVSDYARAAMGWARACGILSGFPDNTIRPGGTANRAQIAKMIVSILDAAPGNAG